MSRETGRERNSTDKGGNSPDILPSWLDGGLWTNEKKTENFEEQQQDMQNKEEMSFSDIDVNTIDLKALWETIESNNDYLVPEKFIQFCKLINHITDAKKRNTMLQLVLVHANSVITDNVNKDVKEWWEKFRGKQGLQQDYPLGWAIANYVYEGDCETEINIEGNKFNPVIPITDMVGAKNSLLPILGIDTVQHIDTVNFRKITLKDYIEDWFVDTEGLYKDIISDDTNFIPENFFDICSELTGIKDVLTRNLLFERIICDAKLKMDAMGEVDEKWADYYAKNYKIPTEKNNIIIYDYFRGLEKDYSKFIVNGIRFKKTNLTNTQQLQTIFNESVSTKPLTLNEMLNTSLKRKEKRSSEQHSYIPKQASGPSRRPSQKESQHSMTSFKDLNVIRNNPSIIKYARTQDVSLPSADEEQQRRQEAVQQELREHLNAEIVPGILPFINLQTGEIINESGLVMYLQRIWKGNEEIVTIITTLYTIHTAAIEKYVTGKREEYVKNQLLRNFRGINQICNYLKNYLNITTKDGDFNILQNYNLNPSEDVEMRDNKLLLKGIVKSGNTATGANTPIFLEYDMSTWALSMNSVVHLEKDEFLTKSEKTNDFLFRLPSLAEIKQTIDPTQSREDFQKEQLKQDEQIGLQKQFLEYKIEKNRTMQYLLSTFDLQLQESYPKGSAGFHMLTIVEQSLTTTEKCRALQSNLEELHRIIGEQYVSSADTETSVTSTQKALPDDRDYTPDEKNNTLQKSTYLTSLFNPTKREQDRQDIVKNVDNKNNSIYLFLKTFTKGISILDDTSCTEHQHLDLVDMKHYLSSVQKDIYIRYTGESNVKIWQCINKMIVASEPPQSENVKKANDRLNEELKEREQPNDPPS